MRKKDQKSQWIRQQWKPRAIRQKILKIFDNEKICQKFYGLEEVALQRIPRGHEMNQTRNDQKLFDIIDLASPIRNHASYELIMEAVTKRTDWNQNKKIEYKED